MAERSTRRMDETVIKGFSEPHKEPTVWTGVKGETDGNISMGEYCINRERITTMHPSLGQLLRIHPLGSVIRTECQLVQPHKYNKGCNSNDPVLQMPKVNGINVSCMSNENSQNSTMIVEIIANKNDRHCIANFLNFELLEVSNGEYYLDEIQEFGFTHIIIIGRLQCGTVFLDCYGRVFNMDSMSGVLCPVVDLKDMSTKNWGQMTWIVEDDGRVVEFEYYPEVV